MLIDAALENDAAKRPKLEAQNSQASSGTGSSTTSQHDGETASRARVEGLWQVGGDGASSPLTRNMPKAPALGSRKSSPNSASPTVLPGYRDSIYPAPAPIPVPAPATQVLPWRDSQREESIGTLPHLARIATGVDRRPSYGEPSDKLNLTGSMQHAHRTGQSHPPPLLTSESTNRSSASSGSTSSYFGPRTPMEPPPERALPLPQLYQNSSFDHQLPPILPPSLSPRTTIASSQQSPNGMSAAFIAPLFALPRVSNV